MRIISSLIPHPDPSRSHFSPPFLPPSIQLRPQPTTEPPFRCRIAQANQSSDVSSLLFSSACPCLIDALSVILLSTITGRLFTLFHSPTLRPLILASPSWRAILFQPSSSLLHLLSPIYTVTMGKLLPNPSSNTPADYISNSPRSTFTTVEAHEHKLLVLDLRRTRRQSHSRVVHLAPRQSRARGTPWCTLLVRDRHHL